MYKVLRSMYGVKYEVLMYAQDRTMAGIAGCFIGVLGSHVLSVCSVHVLLCVSHV